MEHTILILILPFLSFLILGLAGMRMKNGLAGAIGTVSLAGVTLLSYLTAFQLFCRRAYGSRRLSSPSRPTTLNGCRSQPNLHIDMGIMLDPISSHDASRYFHRQSLMVHIYSFGYMKGEKGFQRYYAFLSLFHHVHAGAGSSNQYFPDVRLLGTGGRQLLTCSSAFYYTKKEAIAASKKAFIVTRFADLGFLIGILIYGYYAETFSFTPQLQVLCSCSRKYDTTGLGANVYRWCR